MEGRFYGMRERPDRIACRLADFNPIPARLSWATGQGRPSALRPAHDEPAETRDRGSIAAGEGGERGRRSTSAQELHQEWMRKPAYAKVYDELAEEMALAGSFIRRRAQAS